MADLFISHRAEEELRAIWRYIAADNPDAADRLLLRIDAKLQMLRAFPVTGLSYAGRGELSIALRIRRAE